MKFTREEKHLITIALEELMRADTLTIEDLENLHNTAFKPAYMKEIENAKTLLEKINKNLYSVYEH